jgi:adenylate cyclase
MSAVHTEEPAKTGPDAAPPSPGGNGNGAPPRWRAVMARLAESGRRAAARVKPAWESFRDTALRLGDRFPSLYRIKKHLPTAQYDRMLVLISSMSVSYKIAATLITVLALAIASLGAVTFSRQKKILEQEMKKRAEVLVQHLANVGKEGLLTRQELPVYAVIKDLQSNLGAVYAMVLDEQGRVFVHSELTEKGKLLEDSVSLAAAAASGLAFLDAETDSGPVLDTAVPIILKARNVRLGTARIGLSKKELLASIHRQKVIFSWISIVFVLLGLVISFSLAKVLTRPIYTLAVGMQEVAQGDLSHQVKVYYRDEIGKLTEVFNQMIVSLREKLHMEKYLSNSVMKSIRGRRGTAQLRLGGEKKHVTALFSDVRGFTSMSEKMTPEEIVDVLNTYLNLQGKVVLQRDGVVDKFVGDEVMAIFEGHGQEAAAVRAALEIQMYCKALNWARAATGERQMQVGVGLNCGPVVMGNMGSEEQMNYTVIGDTINLAARLCSAAQSGQVVISKAVADVLGKEAKLKKLEPVMVKGKEKPIDIFEVLEMNGASRRYMRRAIDFEAVYRLEGLEEASTGAVKNVSPLGCLLEAASPLGVGARLSIDVDLRGLRLEKVAAIVRHARKIDAKYYAGLHFDGLPDAVRAQIIAWIHRVESEIVNSTPA